MSVITKIQVSRVNKFKIVRRDTNKNLREVVVVHVYDDFGFDCSIQITLTHNSRGEIVGFVDYFSQATMETAILDPHDDSEQNKHWIQTQSDLNGTYVQLFLDYADSDELSPRELYDLAKYSVGCTISVRDLQDMH